MAKLGVGIGEDFPMDDSARVDNERRRREWARRKQAVLDFWSKVKIAARECFGQDWDYYRAEFRTLGWWPYGVLMVGCAALFAGALTVALAVALASAIVAAAPCLFFSAALSVFVFWMYRKRHGAGPQTIVTPPPAQD